MIRALSFVLLILAAGCGVDDVPPTDTGDMPPSDMPTLDMGQDTEADIPATPDMTPDQSEDLGSDMANLRVEADNYCELTVDMFCAYYLRCGRIAATDAADCRATFLETCNGVYEPVYTAYADAGHLELSESGMQACASHLESVACEEQIFDLDGGCADMWQGLSAVDAPCAPGIGSFVCDADTTCRLDTSFCGTCEAAASTGQACDTDSRCKPDAQCVNSVCVARSLPGESCAGDLTCVLGASCPNDVCQGRTFVAVGQPCDQANRCPYKSACQGGVCVEAGLIGEDCTDRTCASGACVENTCQAMRDEFEGCSENTQCLSGNCNGQFCGPLVSQCILMPQ